MTTADLANTITAVVAIAALLLSLYNFYVDRRDKRMRLRVRLSQGTNERVNKAPENCLFVELMNAGEKSVLVTDVHVECGEKVRCRARSGDGGTTESRVAPGEHAVFLLALSSFVDSLSKAGAAADVQAVAVARDALGTRHRSRPLSVDLDPRSN